MASHTGTRSGTSTASLIPDSIAEIAASFTPAAGTKSTEISILPNEFTASCGVLNTGTPSTLWPPLPGVTPATTLVPYSRISRVRTLPSRPVIPCTTTRFFSSIKIAINARLQSVRPVPEYQAPNRSLGFRQGGIRLRRRSVRCLYS